MMGRNHQNIELQYTGDLIDHLLSLARNTDKSKAKLFEERIQKWAALNTRVLDDETGRLTAKQFELELLEIRKQAKELSRSLTSVADESEIALWRAANDCFPTGEQASDDTVALNNGVKIIDRIEREIDGLAEIADHASQEWASRKPGPQAKANRNAVRKKAVGELGLAWKWLTGKRPTRRTRSHDHSEYKQPYGPFQEFVIAALIPIFGKEDAPSGINAVIKEVVAGLEKPPHAYITSLFHT